MYNSNRPTNEDLPSASRLLRSTALAAVGAAVILVTVVLPAEYGVDPTRVGRLLGLTEMGAIKTQLAAEAEADRQNQGTAVATEQVEAPQQRAVATQTDTGQPETPQTEMAPQAEAAAEAEVEELALPETASKGAAEPTEPEWTETVEFTLSPGEGIEYKLVMEEGGIAEYLWRVDGGVVNFDLHGDGSGRSISYEQGRSVPGSTGAIMAAFTGNHGWFWRNRDDQPITITLHVRGDFSELKRTA